MLTPFRTTNDVPDTCSKHLKLIDPYRNVMPQSSFPGFPSHRDGWVPTSPIGKSVATPVDHPGDVLPKSQNDRRLGAAWRRLLREEEGVALVLAILTMLVLTISLTTVISSRPPARATRTAQTRAESVRVAESGINNALAVLDRELRPVPSALPGRRVLAANAADRVRERQLHGAGEQLPHLERDAGRAAGRPPTAPWKYEWRSRLPAQSESDGTECRGGHPHGQGRRPGGHSNDVAGERRQPAELPLLRRRHVVPELGARQGAGVRTRDLHLGVHRP